MAGWGRRAEHAVGRTRTAPDRSPREKGNGATSRCDRPEDAGRGRPINRDGDARSQNRVDLLMVEHSEFGDAGPRCREARLAPPVPRGAGDEEGGRVRSAGSDVNVEATLAPSEVSPRYPQCWFARYLYRQRVARLTAPFVCGTPCGTWVRVDPRRHRGQLPPARVTARTRRRDVRRVAGVGPCVGGGGACEAEWEHVFVPSCRDLRDGKVNSSNIQAGGRE